MLPKWLATAGVDTVDSAAQVADENHAVGNSRCRTRIANNTDRSRTQGLETEIEKTQNTLARHSRVRRETITLDAALALR